MTAKTKTETMFALVDQWKASSVTQKQFCADNNLKVGTFAYWVAKRRRAESPSSGFATVDVSGVEPTGRLTITYPNGVRIALSSANLPLISQLIRLA